MGWVTPRLNDFAERAQHLSHLGHMQLNGHDNHRNFAILLLSGERRGGGGQRETLCIAHTCAQPWCFWHPVFCWLFGGRALAEPYRHVTCGCFSDGKFLRLMHVPMLQTQCSGPPLMMHHCRQGIIEDRVYTFSHSIALRAPLLCHAS